jgi:hypothetical protein
MSATHGVEEGGGYSTKSLLGWRGQHCVKTGKHSRYIRFLSRYLYQNFIMSVLYYNVVLLYNKWHLKIGLALLQVIVRVNI